MLYNSKIGLSPIDLHDGENRKVGQFSETRQADVAHLCIIEVEVRKVCQDHHVLHSRVAHAREG